MKESMSKKLGKRGCRAGKIDQKKKKDATIKIRSLAKRFSRGKGVKDRGNGGGGCKGCWGYGTLGGGGGRLPFIITK